MLCFTSSAGAPTTNVNVNLWLLSHNNTLWQRSQLPRIEVDLNCDTQAILKIPFVSCYNAFPIQQALTSNYAIGQVQLFPYSALQAVTGSQVANYTIYTHFEDIELIGPAAPESALTPQSGYTSREQNSQGIGPVESAAVAVGRAANIMLPVPTLSAVALPLKWVSNIVARTANVFGWSKPVNASHVMKVNRVPGPYSGTVDNSDNALPASLSVDNQVSVLPGFAGTDVDELDFSFVASIPSYFNQFTWNTADGVGAQKINITLNAAAFFQTRSLLNANCNDYAPVSYVAHFFNNWRGSLVFRFKFVKTEFHSGRLSFAFYPLYPGAPATITYAGSDYLQREVIDIRESNIVELTIPYMSVQPWLQSNNSFGNLVVWVVDPLQAPATVAQSIIVLCEVAGGPDIQFAVPGTNVALTPVLAAVPQANFEFSQPIPEDPPKEPLVPQGARNDCEIVDTCIGTSTVTFDNHANASAAVGEKITSFRTLLKSASWMTYQQGGVTSPLAANAPAYTLTALPFGLGVWYNTATGSSNNSVNADLYTSIASLYGLSRGGTRLRYLIGGIVQRGIVTPATTPTNYGCASTSAIALTGTVTDIIAPGAATAFVPQAVPNLVLHNLVDDKIIEVQVPQYHTMHSRANAFHMVGPLVPYSVSSGAPSTNLQLVTYTRDSFVTFAAARSGADDLNFGQFISVPPMAYIGVNPVANLY